MVKFVVFNKITGTHEGFKPVLTMIKFWANLKIDFVLGFGGITGRLESISYADS